MWYKFPYLSVLALIPSADDQAVQWQWPVPLVSLVIQWVQSIIIIDTTMLICQYSYTVQYHWQEAKQKAMSGQVGTPLANKIRSIVRDQMILIINSFPTYWFWRAHYINFWAAEQRLTLFVNLSHIVVHGYRKQWMEYTESFSKLGRTSYQFVVCDKDLKRWWKEGGESARKYH